MNQQINGETMDFCILLTRASGDDYEASAWANEVIGRSEAYQYLTQFVRNSDETFKTLEELEEYCSDNDLAYVQLSFHRL
jgi:hypothetical protein